MDDMIRKLPWEGLQKNTVMNDDTMIDKRTGKALGPEVDSTYWKDKFSADFIVSIDHKIICRRNSVGEIFPSCIACEMILAMLSNLP